MSFFGALLGGAIGSAISSNGGSFGRFIVLKFKDENECRKIVEDFNEKNGFSLTHPRYGTFYKNNLYEKIEIINSDGEYNLDEIFFVKENEKRVVKLFSEEDGEKNEK